MRDFSGVIEDIDCSYEQYVVFICKLQITDSDVVIDKKITIPKEDANATLLQSVGIKGRFTANFKSDNAKASLSFSSSNFYPEINDSEKIWKLFNREKLSSTEIETWENYYSSLTTISEKLNNNEKDLINTIVNSLEINQIRDLFMLCFSTDDAFLQEYINTAE